MSPRIALAGALLVGEYLLFSLLYDAVQIFGDATHHIGEIAPLPLVVVAAFLAMRANTAAPAIPAMRPEVSRSSWIFLALHGLAYAGLLAASSSMRTDLASGAPLRVPAVLGWSALALATVLALLRFCLDRATLSTLQQSLRGPALVATAVGAAAWFAGQGAKELWGPLARFTIGPVATLLHLMSERVIVDIDEAQVGLPEFWVSVDPVCSGYEGMGLLAVLTGGYVWMFRRTLRFPNALLLPPLAVLCGFFANVVRITALILVGAHGDPRVALSGFHSKAGWLLFSALALGLIHLARRSAFFQRSVEDLDDDNPTALYLGPLLALVGAALVTGLASDGSLDRLELVRLALASGMLWRARAAFVGLLSGSGTAKGVAVGVVVFVLWMLGDQSTSDADQPLRDKIAAAPGVIVFVFAFARVVGSIVVVPLVEELAFRGFLMRRLVDVSFTRVGYAQAGWVAIGLSSLAFGALHDRFWAAALAGAVYGWIARSTDRLGPAVIAHATTNALIAVWVIAFGHWHLWG